MHLLDAPSISKSKDCNLLGHFWLDSLRPRMLGTMCHSCSFSAQIKIWRRHCVFQKSDGSISRKQGGSFCHQKSLCANCHFWVMNPFSSIHPFWNHALCKMCFWSLCFHSHLRTCRVWILASWQHHNNKDDMETVCQCCGGRWPCPIHMRHHH